MFVVEDMGINRGERNTIIRKTAKMAGWALFLFAGSVCIYL